MAKTRSYREHLDEVLKDDAEAVAYLNAALGEEDPEVFLLALRDVARTREGGLAALAETAQLNREPHPRGQGPQAERARALWARPTLRPTPFVLARVAFRHLAAGPS